MSKSHIPLKVKLAAALLTMKRPNEDGVLVYVIGYEQSKNMTADQIIAHFHFDHYPIREADGGPTEPWNITPRPVAEHREKTAKIDIPQLAKQKRLRGETRNGPKKKIAARVDPWPKGRKLQSRGFSRNAVI